MHLRLLQKETSEVSLCYVPGKRTWTTLAGNFSGHFFTRRTSLKLKQNNLNFPKDNNFFQLHSLGNAALVCSQWVNAGLLYEPLSSQKRQRISTSEHRMASQNSFRHKLQKTCRERDSLQIPAAPRQAASQSALHSHARVPRRDPIHIGATVPLIESTLRCVSRTISPPLWLSACLRPLAS